MGHAVQPIAVFSQLRSRSNGALPFGRWRIGFQDEESFLRLIPFPTETRYLSFAFDDYDGVTAAMSEVSRRSLAAECFAFDPYLQGQRLKREGLLTDIKRLAGVARSGKSIIDGVKGAAKVAAGGRRMFEGVEYSVHLVIDGLRSQNS